MTAVKRDALFGVVVLAIGLLLGCLAACRSAPPARSAARSVLELRSNVARADYVGSARCRECHADVCDAWQSAPMHTMTRDAASARIQAPFDGAEFHFKGESVRLAQENGQRFLQLESPRGARRFRVTKVIGGRTREDFAGVEVGVAGGAELVLPVSWLIEPKTFRYKGYSVMNAERPWMMPGPAWAKTCIFCHNTAPYLSTLFGPLSGSTRGYQGITVDHLLPGERRWSFSVTDESLLDRAAGEEIAFLEGLASSSGRARDAVAVTRERFDARHLVELGIGCEACHGGCKEHVDDPRVHPSFEPRAPFFAIDKRPTRAEAINRACARCHQVLFTGYPWTWEGARRSAREPGGSHINSGEARDFLLGGCASKMSCEACHDVHGSRAKQSRSETREGNATCVACHASFKDESAARAHSHHSLDGAAGACLACHMPKKNMSLDARLGRYHRIGSPTDPRRVLFDRPLECALCHANKSVEELVRTMEAWWKKSYDRAILTKLYGALDANAMRATLAMGKPHEQAVALSALGDAKDRGAASLVARQLVNPYPLVREYARAALTKIAARPCDVDLNREDSEIEASARRWLADAGLAIDSAPWTKESVKPTRVEDDGD